MKTLFETDYVIYDKANDNVIKFTCGDIVIYADKEEALIDCRGNEYVVPCTQIPQHWQETLIKQINRL
jgi:hypothetical protein